MASRPILITILALLSFIVGILMILGGLLATTIVTVLGYGGILMGIIFLIIGFALWRGWKIAWYLGVIIYIISAIFAVVSILLLIMDGQVNEAVVSPAIALIISVLILFYLFRPNVKEFFGIGR